MESIKENDISFSVIIPLYNKEKSIVHTLESVLAQTYPYFEIILVNDGSTDNSLEMATTLLDKRIRIINVPNRGVSQARNIGIAAAKENFIVFLDADDLWFPDCLNEFKKLIHVFPKASVYCTSHTLSIKEIKSVDKRYYIYDFYKATAESYAKNTVAVLCTGCVAIKKECFLSVGQFKVGLTHGEDLDMWERLASKYIFAKSDIVTMRYRLDAENRSDLKTDTYKPTIQLVKRKEIKNKSQRLDFGCKYFFHIYQNVVANKEWRQSFCIIIKYGDWITRFAILIIKKKLEK